MDLKKPSSFGLPSGCRVFGNGVSAQRIKEWLSIWRDCAGQIAFFLILAGSETAAVEGISEAGATPESRKFTAVADAELLLYGASPSRRTWPLPALSAGVSPALIGFVAGKWIQIDPVIVAIGLDQEPSFPHVLVDSVFNGPSACLSTGKAMSIERVQNLWKSGLRIGREINRPLLIAECVPGGTTTAQAVLTGLGFPVAGLVSGSALNPPRDLKKKLVKEGLLAANLGIRPSPQALLAAIGDPFQPFAAGLLLGAREAGQNVLLGGGSQMLAVLALALESLNPANRDEFVEGISLATTAWLAEEGRLSSSDASAFEQLLDLIGEHFQVGLLAFASGLRFNESNVKVLYDYELGYIKEGVGAGALSLLAQLNGASTNQLALGCEEVVINLFQ